MVPVTGLEPVQHHCREILSLLCLPFHHTGSFSATNRIPQCAGFCQGLVEKTFRQPSLSFAAAGKKEPLSAHRRAAQAGGILESFRDHHTAPRLPFLPKAVGREIFCESSQTGSFQNKTGVLY